MEKVNTANIPGTMPPIFFILSPYVWENNGLFNYTNYRDDLGVHFFILYNCLLYMDAPHKPAI